MGVSTDAILVWGFDLGDPQNMIEPVQARIDHLLEDGYDEMQALEKETGAELIQHCSNECPMYIVGFTATKVRAWRGRPKVIESLALDVAEAQAAIEAFARKLGLSVEKGRWLLASDWS